MRLLLAGGQLDSAAFDMMLVLGEVLLHGAKSAIIKVAHSLTSMEGDMRADEDEWGLPPLSQPLPEVLLELRGLARGGL